MLCNKVRKDGIPLIAVQSGLYLTQQFATMMLSITVWHFPSPTVYMHVTTYSVSNYNRNIKRKTHKMNVLFMGF